MTDAPEESMEATENVGTPEPRALVRARAALDGVEFRVVDSSAGDAGIGVSREDLHDTLLRLRDGANFEAVTFVTGLDHLPKEPRFEVVWQLWSASNSDRLRVRVSVEEGDEWVPTCTDIWPGAAYAERECFDMFGIRFEGHEGLKRLLMPEAYEHHPLRKDFPHAGIEPDKLYREWDAERRREWAEEEASR